MKLFGVSWRWLMAVALALAGLGSLTASSQAQEALVREWNGGGLHWVETEVVLEAGRTYRFQGGCFDASGLGIYRVHQFQLVRRDNGQVNTQYYDCIGLNLYFTPPVTGTYWMVFHVHTNSPDLQLWLFTHQLRVSLVDGNPPPAATTVVPQPTITPYPEATPTRVPPTAGPTTQPAPTTTQPTPTTTQPASTTTQPAPTVPPTATATERAPNIGIERLPVRVYLPGLIKLGR